MTIEFAATPTMAPSHAWVDMDDDRRMELVRTHWFHAGEQWGDWHELISIKEAHPNGHVIVELTKQLSAAERGQVLLDCEEFLKEKVDEGITVWLAPLGDKNSLRNLRGIEMK